MNIVEIFIAIALFSYLIYGFYVLNIAKKNYSEVNLNDLELIPSMFTTIGILGTFGGIAYGLWFFNPEDIEKSIPTLLQGLKTAFLASIVGIALSIIFSKIISFVKNKNEKGVLSDETKAINKLIEAIEELRNDFYTIDENGNTIKPGNVFRDIYKESQKQSTSLQTFSSDLALTISAGFEQILNNPTEGVVAELKLVKAEIESLGNKLKDPATDMTQNIVKELQESMGKMIEEFKTSMSGETKNEMERLAGLLGQAGGSLTDFPLKLQNMTDNLNENFRGLQEVVQQISKQTLSQSEESTNQMKMQIEDMIKILREQVGGLQTGQQTLLTEQSKNLQVSENLLSAFNTSIEKMNGLSTEVNGSISKLNQAQSELEKVISTFRNVSQEINASSSKFGESQNEFSKHTNQFLQNNSNTIIEIQKSLETAKTVSADYAQKFEIIEKGLQDIFGKITTGLKDYQATVGGSLETYLGKYTDALTKTAESLAGASSKQEDILEELTEQLSKLNGRRN
ncbi:MotA/TolQ/ExbB proton channel family protein [Emticicia sp. 17c]|uniref:MotA/TolQ/ExbB proton channel family protein n=1 Tax=Emticicia sp. 17c TaxID=3127704 RepID=UPI00301CC758